MNRDDPHLSMENIIKEQEAASSAVELRRRRKYVKWTSTEVCRVKTSHGELCVTVKRSAETCRRHFVTYHDVASDPSVCFYADVRPYGRFVRTVCVSCSRTRSLQWNDEKQSI